MMNRRTSCIALAALLALAGCKRPAESTAETARADLILHGGSILTLAGDAPAYAEAVAVMGGQIIAVGSDGEVMKLKGERTVVRDLAGSTLLPGFVDAHSHFINAPVLSQQVNVSPPPVGPGNNVASIVAALKNYQDDAKIPEDGWILAWGYDDSMVEGSMLTRKDLDAAFPKHKVMVMHVSLHGAVLNSPALQWAGISRETPTPPGGIIARGPDGKEPLGLLMETAFLPVYANLPQPPESELLGLLQPGQMLYAANGFTLANEGFTHTKDLRFLQKAAAEDRLFIDIVALPGFSEMDQWMGSAEFPFGTWNKRLKLQGIKITQDGSVQGKTASYLEPMLTGGPQGQKDWRGNTTLPYEQFAGIVAKAHAAGVQLFIHANGDGAIQQAIKAVEATGIRAGDDSRTIIIHSQMQHPQDIPRYVELGITPSYFTMHTYLWGDVHRKNLGEERAAWLSPMKGAMDAGLKATNHTDFNVTPLDPMMVLWTSMARSTRSGFALGPEQRIDAYRGLQALTINAAWEYREESRRGSIEPGKLADFVILSADPVKTDVGDIRGIKVLETIKDGKTIFAAP